MDQDPIVADVREARRRIFFEECGGDWKRFWDRMKEIEGRLKDRVVAYADVHGEAASKK